MYAARITASSVAIMTIHKISAILPIESIRRQSRATITTTATRPTM